MASQRRLSLCPSAKVGNGWGALKIAGGDVVVEGFECVLEGVVVAFVVAAGIADVGAAASETRPGSRSVAGWPGCGGRSRVRWAVRCSRLRCLAAGDLVTQTVLAPGGYLGYPEGAVRAALKRRSAAPLSSVSMAIDSVASAACTLAEKVSTSPMGRWRVVWTVLRSA